MNIRAIIVDDELKSVENLKILLDSLDMNVSCIGCAHNVVDGIALINNLKPDLLFLDINMPNHNGFDLLKAIDTEKFSVVFTTAYEEYAVQSIKHRAFDYLLKPIDIDELQSCITRYKKEQSQKNIAGQSRQIKIVIKEGILFLKQEEIIRIEANGSYSAIFMTNGQKHTVSKNLKSVTELLESHLFFRCHNSHIINLRKVKKFHTGDGFFIEMEDNSVAEVSRNKKDELLERI
jgi:two-component system, LytTR family, response regulator